MKLADYNNMELTKAGDYPFVDENVKVIRYNGGKVWLESPEGFAIKVSRPKRDSWTQLYIGKIINAKIGRQLKAGGNDELKNYYAYIHINGCRNQVLPYGTKMKGM